MRNRTLYDFEKHKTPRDVAEYFRYEGRKIGKEYATHGDVWDVKDSVVQTGLLHLILDELKKTPTDPLDNHDVWVRKEGIKCLKLIKTHERESSRLIKMFGTKNLGHDLVNRSDIHYLSKLFRSDRPVYHKRIMFLKEKIARLKSVKKPDDVINLEGIGKKTTQKLIDGIGI